MLYYVCMTAREIMDILKAHGWMLDRITSSHHVFVKPGRRPVPVPLHGSKDLGDFGKRILDQAGIKIRGRKKNDL
jgi:predicted RNA binding protein YcfA (HicA-like mRNA interferase family)